MTGYELTIAALVHRLGGDVVLARHELAMLDGQLIVQPGNEPGSTRIMFVKTPATVEATYTKENQKALYEPAPEEGD